MHMLLKLVGFKKLITYPKVKHIIYISYQMYVFLSMATYVVIKE